MRLRLVVVALFAASIAALALPFPPVRAGPDAGAGERNQFRGDAARSSSADRAPILADPKIGWRMKPPGELLSNLVSWGGTVYFVTRDKKRRRLYAVRAIDGEIQADKTLSGGGSVDLAVWQGTVILREKDLLSAYPHRSSSLSRGWKKKGKWRGRTLVHAGRIILSDDKRIHILDVKNGKKLASAFTVRGCLALGEQGGRMCVAGVNVVEAEEDNEATVLLVKVGIKDLAGRKPAFETPRPETTGIVAAARSEVNPDKIAVHRIQAKKGFWMVQTSHGFLAEDGSKAAAAFVADNGSGGLSPLTTVPAAVEGILLGFNRAGSLIAVASHGGSAEVVEKSALPKGARPGPATICRGAIVFGNWALDTESGRVLWCLPDLSPVGQAVPAADGVLVVPVKGGDIVGLVDARRLVQQDSPSAAATPAERPTAENLLVLANGRRIEGKVATIAGGRIRVTPASGDPVEVDKADVVLAVAGGKVLAAGEENDIYGLWRDALDGCVVKELEGIFESYRKTGLLKDCRRILAEAKEYGLVGAEHEKWNRRLTGRAERSVQQVRKNLLKKESRLRGDCFESFVEASAWCRKNGFKSAASALLYDADQVAPGHEGLEDLAKPLIPAGFPWRDRPDAARQWIHWAARILPAGAEFLGPDDEAWERVTIEPWNEHTIGFRTRNLLMFSRSYDIEAVGRCLRRGQGTVRVLDTLLNEGKPTLVLDDNDRLEVRIHRNRKEFMAEEPGETEHLAGYYTPGEHVSRFFVPRESESGELMGRSLFEVLSHELTHQYIEETWLGRDTSDDVETPGYWVVEGLARFVEDQSLEMGRRGLRFDDTTVSSLDCSARLMEKNALIPMRTFLAMDHIDFAQLGHDPAVTISLRNTLATYKISPVLIFYEQAGSLVFYLMNRAGPKARKALIQFMMAHYQGELERPSGAVLGFPSVDALEKGFREFLKGL